MTIDIVQFRAELRRDVRRFALLAGAGALAAFAAGIGLGVLWDYLAGTLCR